jgi:acyl-CoA thioesterase FadM
MEIRYRQNVPVGQPLRVVGRAVKSRGRTATATGAIYGQDDALLAEADILLVDVPSDVVGSVDLAALGWQVYEESDEGIGK